MITVIYIIILVVVCIFHEFSKRRQYASLPPGPVTFTFLGNIHCFVGKRPNYEVITDLSKKYGDIFTIWIFNKPVVFLSSMRAVREALLGHNEMSDRPATLLSELIGGFGFKDYTPKTQVMRNAFVQSIRSFWNSPKAVEEVVKVVEDVIDEIISKAAEKKKPIEMREYTVKIIYNMTMLFGFGKRFALDDAQFVNLCKSDRTTDDILRASQVYDSFPFLRHLGLHNLSPGFKKLIENIDTNKTYLKYCYEEIKTPKSKEDEIECFAHGFRKRLKAANKTANDDSIREGIEFGDEDVVNTLYPMFFGATSTTTKNLNWLLLEMVLHPEMQEKCYQELVRVTNGRPVTQSDRSHLPYIEACIMEVLRFHPAAPFNVPHASHSDVTIRNYKIPAGVDVVVNLWDAQREENLVKDAHNFNPQNFLDDEGQFFRPQDMFPFGAGRRMCPGEAHAKLNMFFAFATLLRRLRFDRVDKYEYDTAPDPSKLPSLSPKKYYIKIVERKDDPAYISIM